MNDEVTLFLSERQSTGTDGTRGSVDSKKDSQATRRSDNKAAPSVALLRLVLLSLFGCRLLIALDFRGQSSV